MAQPAAAVAHTPRRTQGRSATTPAPADIALQPVSPPTFGDSDCDGDVDLDDFEAFSDCLTGPGGGATGCGIFDAESDNDIDLDDYGAFQLAFTG